MKQRCALMLAVVWFAGCASAPEKRMVGKWIGYQGEKEAMACEFLVDGSVRIRLPRTGIYAGREEVLKYKFTDSRHLRLEAAIGAVQVWDVVRMTSEAVELRVQGQPLNLRRVKEFPYPWMALGTFGIADLRFADSDTAPPRATTEYKPEDDVRIFYEVPGYARDKDSYISVVARHQVTAPDGKPFFETKTIEVKQQAGEDAGPVKCNFHMSLPAWAPPGQYAINIQAEDQIAHKTQAATASFTVNAPPLETSATLVAKSIELANSRDGAALAPPVFTPGQSIWLRFRVLGLKANDQGQIHLTEDWGIIGPDGKPLFEQNDTELVNEQYVYPPPHVPVTDHVNTPSSVEPGEYKFHVVLHDKIGGADFTIDEPFTISKP